MSFWLFKVSEQNLYPDKPGSAYVYDNRHSVRVRRGDEFIYLDKRQGKYCFTGAGVVQKVSERNANKEEKHSPSVKTVYTANLGELVWFNPPLDISPSTRQGREARVRLGLPDNVNEIGWSISMPQITKELFEVLLDEALSQENLPKKKFADSGNWRVEDKWSTVKQEH